LTRISSFHFDSVGVRLTSRWLSQQVVSLGIDSVDGESFRAEWIIVEWKKVECVSDSRIKSKCLKALFLGQYRFDHCKNQKQKSHASVPLRLRTTPAYCRCTRCSQSHNAAISIQMCIRGKQLGHLLQCLDPQEATTLCQKFAHFQDAVDKKVLF
jgi:hypothetical protein